MKVLDPGHTYQLDVFDGGSEQHLYFMKREGPGYPGNTSTNPGTNCQEVLRVLIDRVRYLDNQIPCEENKVIIEGLKTALLMFEVRAMRRHGIDRLPACLSCGHIACEC